MRGPLRFSRGWIDSQEPLRLFDTLSTAMCLQARGWVAVVGSRRPDSPLIPVTVIERDVLFPLIKDAAITSRKEPASLSVLQ